jgi:hypothetical protein
MAKDATGFFFEEKNLNYEDDTDTTWIGGDYSGLRAG